MKRAVKCAKCRPIQTIMAADRLRRKSGEKALRRSRFTPRELSGFAHEQGGYSIERRDRINRAARFTVEARLRRLLSSLPEPRSGGRPRPRHMAVALWRNFMKPGWGRINQA